MSAERSAIVLEGYDAGSMLALRSDCPYPDEPRRSWWLEGFDEYSQQELRREERLNSALAARRCRR